MPETETEKSVQALKVVPCPWHKGTLVTLSLCSACQYHGGLKEHYENPWNEALQHTEKVKVKESITCNYPRTLQVAHVVVEP